MVCGKANHILLIVVSGIAVFLAACAGVGLAAETSGHGEPQDTIMAFCESIAAADFEKTLDLFQNDSISPDAYARIVKQSDLRLLGELMPSEMRGYTTLNQATARGRTAEGLKYFLWCVLLPKNFARLLDLKAIGLPEDGGKQIAAYLQALNTSRLKGLNVAGMQIISEDSPHFSDARKSGWVIMRQVAPFEDLRICQVFYELNGEYFKTSHILAKRDNDWKIVSLFDPSSFTNGPPVERVDADAVQREE